MGAEDCSLTPEEKKKHTNPYDDHDHLDNQHCRSDPTVG